MNNGRGRKPLLLLSLSEAQPHCVFSCKVGLSPTRYSWINTNYLSFQENNGKKKEQNEEKI